LGSGIVFSFLSILSTYFGFYWFGLDYKLLLSAFFDYMFQINCT